LRAIQEETARGDMQDARISSVASISITASLSLLDLYRIGPLPVSSILLGAINYREIARAKVKRVLIDGTYQPASPESEGQPLSDGLVAIFTIQAICIINRVQTANTFLLTLGKTKSKHERLGRRGGTAYERRSGR
jgi:hypothetical protein